MAQKDQFTLVTPEMAAKWLQKNDYNRDKKDESGVNKYARDMENGRWTVCTAAIAFYKNGHIADGQNRLMAIVKCGIPQRFLVVNGLDLPDGANIDKGVPRSLIDSAKISGQHEGLSAGMISVSRGIAYGGKTTFGIALSDSEKLEVVRRHEQAAKFAITAIRRTKYLSMGPVTSALGRAVYVENLQRLREFGEIYSNGIATSDRDSAAIALRTYVLQNGTQLALTQNWRDTFMKAQNAIWYFCRGKPLTVIRRVADEKYPMLGANQQGKLL